ncbi:TadE/TadG family type IV pilus assembly protein [Massilia sp. Leaf139]|uniref:TadE/TadG family type IV pilus assembly protein n=1 Tax=Massilia sp. Leaf139 TaxID=1736272 RepID=UPI0009EA6496|nr:TadE family protein [Massilia sp. Leaf139]
MSAIKLPRALPQKTHQRGVAAVEFALLILVFLSFVLCIIELARIMYLYNTFQEVTRSAARGASSANFQDQTALDRIRYLSIFRQMPGELPLGMPVTHEHVRIDYLALVRDADGTLTPTRIDRGALPASPAANRQTCHTNPNAPTCVRLVRAQICNPGVPVECERVQYQMLFPLLRLTIPLPRATTTATAESLGYVPGEAP